MPGNNRIEITKTAMVGGGVLLILIGGGLGLFLHAKRLLPHFRIFDNNDPPVTVGDSSFDANSWYAWASHNDTVLVPNGMSSTGTLVNQCGLPGSGLVAFDDGSNPPNPQDISPPSNTTLNITIVHGGGQINATTKPDPGKSNILGNLNITDQNHGWRKPNIFDKISNSNSAHITVVQYVKPDGSPGTIPAKGGNNLAQVLFCYQ